MPSSWSMGTHGHLASSGRRRFSWGKGLIGAARVADLIAGMPAINSLAYIAWVSLRWQPETTAFAGEEKAYLSKVVGERASYVSTGDPSQEGIC